MRSLVLTLLLLVATLQVACAEVQGGGLTDTDCRMVFRGVTATNERSGVVCTDGDPTCDADGVADGTCSFGVRLCTGTSSSSCDTTLLSSANTAGLHLLPPHLPASDGSCGPTLSVTVPEGSTAAATVLALDGSSLRDVDYLNLCCVAGDPTPLDAARCAVGISLRASGCPLRKIPLGARRAFTRAQELLKGFADDPSRTKDLNRASRKIAVVHRAAQHLAKHDQCGDALGLAMIYAQDMVARVAAH